MVALNNLLNLNMEPQLVFSKQGPGYAIVVCLLLAILYVGSLYIWSVPFARDHPATIKQRIRRVLLVCLAAPVFLALIAEYPQNGLQGHSLSRWLGIHCTGLIMATALSLVLTMILFIGPLLLDVLTGNLQQTAEIFSSKAFLADLLWLRNFVVAPVSEEFIFRACMMPILVPCFGLSKSILIAPLFFGIAHLHHATEYLRAGHPPVQVWLNSIFQMTYTTIFGAYSAFLFVRTGHLAAPVVSHVFCNMMGFPEFEKIPSCRFPKAVMCAFVIGLVLFICLADFMTRPAMFESIYFSSAL